MPVLPDNFSNLTVPRPNPQRNAQKSESASGLLTRWLTSRVTSPSTARPRGAAAVPTHTPGTVALDDPAGRACCVNRSKPMRSYLAIIIFLRHFTSMPGCIHGVHWKM
jgi:hypothetical protein